MVHSCLQTLLNDDKMTYFEMINLNQFLQYAKYRLGMCGQDLLVLIWVQIEIYFLPLHDDAISRCNTKCGFVQYKMLSLERRRHRRRRLRRHLVEMHLRQCLDNDVSRIRTQTSVTIQEVSQLFQKLPKYCTSIFYTKSPIFKNSTKTCQKLGSFLL